MMSIIKDQKVKTLIPSASLSVPKFSEKAIFVFVFGFVRQEDVNVVFVKHDDDQGWQECVGGQGEAGKVK